MLRNIEQGIHLIWSDELLRGALIELEGMTQSSRVVNAWIAVAEEIERRRTAK